MQKIDLLLSDYSAYHSTTGNKVCHFIGIPLIVFGILSILGTIRLSDPWTAAELLIVLASIYYFLLDLRLAFLMLIATAALDFLVIQLNNVWPGVAAFVIGWIFQGIGHAVYEKNSPAFLRNLQHLLVGPLFLLNEAFRIRRLTTPVL